MSQRFLALVGPLIIVMAVLSPSAGLAQDADKGSPQPQGHLKRDPLTKDGCIGCVAKPATPAKAWNSPHTPWGDPDLQGLWNDATITPLQRPTGQLGDKDVLNDEDADLIFDDISRDRRDGGPDADVARAYNDFWMDHGTIVRARHPSLIVDPPEGRIPPATPDLQKRMAAGADDG